MRILIIRHAEPDYENNTLTEKGFREADILSERLKTRVIDDIYSSPLPRALYTAQPTADKLGKDVHVLDWLHEFRGRVIMPNGEEDIAWNIPPRLWTEMPEIYRADSWKNAPMYASVNAPAEYERVTCAFDSLLEKYGMTRKNQIYTCAKNPNTTIALFCHFALGMVLISHLTGVSPVLLLQTMFLPTSSVTEFVTEERVEGEVIFKCMQMGDTSHLYAKGEPVSASGLYREFFAGVDAPPQE